MGPRQAAKGLAQEGPAAPAAVVPPLLFIFVLVRALFMYRLKRTHTSVCRLVGLPRRRRTPNPSNLGGHICFLDAYGALLFLAGALARCSKVGFTFPFAFSWAACKDAAPGIRWPRGRGGSGGIGRTQVVLWNLHLAIYLMYIPKQRGVGGEPFKAMHGFFYKGFSALV